MGISVLLMALLMSSAPQAPAAGSYRLVGEQDVASGLLLRPDGTFEYFLSAGALDEHSKGRWALEGTNIRLQTLPKPLPPAFSRQKRTTSTDAPLQVTVVWPDGRGIPGVDVRVGFDRGAFTEGYTQEYGWSLPTEEKRVPKWIELEVPMHQLRSERFPVSPSEGSALTFVLIPNDMGLVDFDGTLLELGPGKLVMHRSGSALTYVRETE